MPTLNDHTSTAKPWKLPLTPSAAGKTTVTLNTADTYVDQNIVIEETVAAGELSSVAGSKPVASASVKSGTSYFTTGSNTSAYKVTIAADAAATSASGTVSVTKAGWVDEGAPVTVTTPAATQATVDKYIIAGALGNASGGNVTATAGLADTTYLTEDSSLGYGPITATADASRTAVSVGVTTAGWIPTTASKTSAAADATQDSVTKYVKKGTVQNVAGNKPTSTAGFDTASTNTYFTTTDTTYPIVATSSTGATSKANVAPVKQDGWLKTTDTITVTTAANTGSTTKYLKPGKISASATTGVTYTDVSETKGFAIPSGGYLYIDKGWLPDDARISLAKLVPDGSNIQGAEDFLYKTKTAYDNDGALVTGAMDKATISASVTSATASANISSISPAYNSTSGKYDVTGSGTITGTANVSATTTTSGLAVNATDNGTSGKYAALGVTSATGSGAISGTASLSDVTLNKTTLGVSVTGSGTVTPIISNKTQAVTGKTQITAAPVKNTTTGIDKYYMAVETAAISKTAKATPTATAGYTDGTNHGGNTAVNVTAGAATSGIYYIPVASAEISAAGSIADVTATISNPAYQSSGDNAGKFKVSASGSTSGSTAATVSTSGYVEAGTTIDGSVEGGTISGDKYLDKIEVKATKGTDGAVKPVISEKTASAGTGKVQVSATPTTSASDVTKYYVAVNTAAITASTTVTPGVSKAGYGTTTSGQYASAGNVTVTRGASASDTTYIPLASGSHSIAGNGAATVTKASVTASVSGTGAANTGATYYGAASPLLTSKPATGAYIEIGGSGSGTQGSISIPVKCTSTAGYVEAGTETFSAQGNVGVDVTDSAKKYIKVYDGAYTIA